MSQKLLKYRVINDWSGLMGIFGFVCIMLSGFSLYSSDHIMSIGAFIVGFGILTKAVETVVDIDNKTVIQYSSVFLFIKLKDRKEYAATHFDTVRLYVHSEVSKHRTVIQTGVSRVREYNVDLYSPGSNSAFSVAVFTDYNEARKLLFLLAKSWQFKPEDEIAFKLARNKQEQNERLKKRKK